MFTAVYRILRQVTGEENVDIESLSVFLDQVSHPYLLLVAPILTESSS